MSDYKQIAGDYIRQNFEKEDRLAVVLIRRGEDGRADDVQQKLVTAEQLASEEYLRFLGSQNAKGCDVYVSMNTIAENATGRTKADIAEIRHVYLDIDVGGQEALQRVLGSKDLPEPHHVLETSPGKHQVVWQVEGFVKGQAEDLLHGMAAAHGADAAVTDCARVLRVPGFKNCKYEKPHYVRDVGESSWPRVYRPEDFPQYRQERTPAAPSAGPKQNFSGTGQQSQSEKDWAFAMRSLERGESPQAVEARIMSFRADKPNPQYYAHHTVSRALQHLARKASQPDVGSGAGKEPETLSR